MDSYTTSVRGVTLLSSVQVEKSVPRQHAIPEPIHHLSSQRGPVHAGLVGIIDLQMPCTLLRFSRRLAEPCSSQQTTHGLKAKQGPNPPPAFHLTRAKAQQSGRTRRWSNTVNGMLEPGRRGFCSSVATRIRVSINGLDIMSSPRGRGVHRESCQSRINGQAD